MIELMGDLNLEKYMGEWYEMARKPAFFQKQCKASKAKYELQYKGKMPFVKVINSCIKENGQESNIEGKAKIKGPRALAVRFNFFMNMFNSINYEVIFVDTEYQVAIVGSPNKKYLWILSRHILPKDEIQKLLDIAKLRGFDIGDVVYDTY